MKLVLIKQDSAEWNYMWDLVRNHPINESIEEPTIALNNGEAWQYMGSYRQDDKVIHTFRHRNHPKTNRRYDLTLHSSKGLTDEQIQKEKRL